VVGSPIKVQRSHPAPLPVDTTTSPCCIVSAFRHHGSILLAKTSAETHTVGQDRLTVIDDSILHPSPSDGPPVRDPQVALVLAEVTAQPQIVTRQKRSTSASPRRFSDLLALDDFERHGRHLLPPMVHLHVAGAVETGASLRRAKAYDSRALPPRMLHDVSGAANRPNSLAKPTPRHLAQLHWAAPRSWLTVGISCSPRRRAWPMSP
jgi:hypothetical protein